MIYISTQILPGPVLPAKGIIIIIILYLLHIRIIALELASKLARGI
jgi:hypothetical protein